MGGSGVGHTGLRAGWMGMRYYRWDFKLRSIHGLVGERLVGVDENGALNVIQRCVGRGRG